MTDFNAAACQQTIFDALLDARSKHGGGKVILADPDGTTLTYDRLVLGSLVLGRKLAALGRDTSASRDGGAANAPIALLLPTVAGLVVSILGLNAFGRTVAVLNYTAGYRNLASALRTGVIHQVVTSRRFIDKANLQTLIEDLATVEVTPGRRIEIVYLEDIRTSIGLMDKARGFIDAWFARQTHRRHRARPDRAGVLLLRRGPKDCRKVSFCRMSTSCRTRARFSHTPRVICRRPITS